jgi:hypothetical protein
MVEITFIARGLTSHPPKWYVSHNSRWDPGRTEKEWQRRNGKNCCLSKSKTCSNFNCTMARLRYKPNAVGTQGPVVIYKLGKEFYIRAKSSLSSKRVKKSPEFKRTMESARLLGRASKIASQVYGQLPEKIFEHYRSLTGQAMKLLKSGVTENEVLLRLANAGK